VISPKEDNAIRIVDKPAPAGSDCGVTCLPAFLDSIGARISSPVAARALRLLRREPMSFVSVGEWAARIHVSREHLTRTLSPVINPHALILATRVSLVMTAVAQQPRLRAGKALDLMGFSSRAHAFTAFKTVTGLTPSEWWHRHQKDRIAGRRSCLVDRCPLVGSLLDRVEKRAARRPAQVARAS
jgi:AraC-like DNA-binding protein